MIMIMMSSLKLQGMSSFIKKFIEKIYCCMFHFILICSFSFFISFYGLLSIKTELLVTEQIKMLFFRSTYAGMLHDTERVNKSIFSISHLFIIILSLDYEPVYICLVI